LYRRPGLVQILAHTVEARPEHLEAQPGWQRESYRPCRGLPHPDGGDEGHVVAPNTALCPVEACLAHDRPPGAPPVLLFHR
jgi:hypothetical protein